MPTFIIEPESPEIEKSSVEDLRTAGQNSCPLWQDFEAGVELGSDQERQRLAVYFHDQLAPNLMALAFSIETIRMELESEKHPAEAKLKDIRDRLSKMLQPIRENILKPDAII